MHTRTTHRRRRTARRMLISTTVAVGLALAAGASASAAVTATFNNGVLSVFGDGADNNIRVTRNAAGRILVNGGAVPVTGGTPTVANTALIQVFGLGGTDVLTLDQTNGALPRANLFGGTGNDVLTGGAGSDQLFGQSGNDTLLGSGAGDLLFGGTDNDVLTGGDADDLVFGESGDDRMIWNPGDDTDLNEGGAGVDNAEVNGGGGAEQFTTTANGTRVRFDRVNPAPFAIDIGTSENLVLRANGGDDSYSATGNLAALIKITVDGGAGNDSLLGSNGVDVLLGSDGNDFVDGQQGNDVGLLGAGDDTFQWDPGDGSDVVEGQDGADTMRFNGSNGAEIFAASANGQRQRFTRNLGNIVIDTDGVEIVDLHALGGADTLAVDDLSGTDVARIDTDLAGAPGGTAGDGQADNVIVNATNGDDVVLVGGDANASSVLGLAAQVNITGTEAANDRLTVNALGGDDVVEASAMSAGAIQLTADGGEGDDVLLGGEGNDVLRGGNGDDVLLGGGGNDVIDGGNGDDVEIQSLTATAESRQAASDTVSSASTADAEWVADHVRIDEGATVIEVDGTEHELVATDMSQLVTDANAELAADEATQATTDVTTEIATDVAISTPPATTEPAAG